jgi:hypothetical protein
MTQSMAVIIVELILPQFQRFVSSDLVDGCSMYEHKTHHVVGGVPSRYNVMRNELVFEAQFGASATPDRKGNSCRIDDCKEKLSYLVMQIVS